MIYHFLHMHWIRLFAIYNWQFNFWNTNVLILNNVAGFVSVAALLLGIVINTTWFYLSRVEKAPFWKVPFQPIAKVMKFYHSKLILLGRAVPFPGMFLNENMPHGQTHQVTNTSELYISLFFSCW